MVCCTCFCIYRSGVLRKFRTLNLHDRMTECHEVCDESAFMPTKEFPYESIFREAQYLLRYLVGSEYAKNR